MKKLLLTTALLVSSFASNAQHCSDNNVLTTGHTQTLEQYEFLVNECNDLRLLREDSTNQLTTIVFAHGQAYASVFLREGYNVAVVTFTNVTEAVSFKLEDNVVWDEQGKKATDEYSSMVMEVLKETTNLTALITEATKNAKEV